MDLARISMYLVLGRGWNWYDGLLEVRLRYELEGNLSLVYNWIRVGQQPMLIMFGWYVVLKR